MLKIFKQFSESTRYAINRLSSLFDFNLAWKWDVNPNGDPAVVGINAPTNATYEITDKRLCVPVVTLSTQDDNKLLK